MASTSAEQQMAQSTAEWVGATTPPFEPLKSPVARSTDHGDEEAVALAASILCSIISAEDDSTPPPPHPAVAIKLPAMIEEEEEDPLLVRPSPECLKQQQVIRGEVSFMAGGGTSRVRGWETVHRLGRPIVPHPQEPTHWVHRVGVDAPWAPSALTANDKVRAIAEDAAAFARDGAREPANRSSRPVGVFDRAEVLYYQHRQRVKFVRRYMARGHGREEARATAGRLAGGSMSWAELEEQAESAKMALQVWGKLKGDWKKTPFDPCEGRLMAEDTPARRLEPSAGGDAATGSTCQRT